ncbi:hypothetical protein B0F90DRAFT_1722600 [Multifurca ochricompacta]|uniref:Bromo domain-containing protein n=1 Tax=Multifurca ochricompacta TaxID=376703 RepID=A0AAD4M5Z8_9AGAM|nr:hypothetical protein B0F90DRAFT_1722600 [Multifurca ochricompacta]
MNDADTSANRVGPNSLELNAKKKSSPLLEPTQKDDYAFFLEPVDPEKVPGYSGVIKQPMDFGTMTDKVAKSKYKSLDEFADDFHLVISNAKTFNLPGTIYHTEAERIEAWASDHIAKAASYVIEYETDWNIEIERDDDVNVDADEDGAAEGASAGFETPARRSPSVASASVPPPNRRGKNAAKKAGVSETLEPDGHLPGYKDGVMLALKFKGKRYRSKKERLRMEKGGPPYAADGSLDYAEMEDPFSVLSALVPEPPCAPLLTPIFPPPALDSSQISLPLPINVPPPEDSPESPAPIALSTGGSKSKYRHWSVTRVAPQRGKAKETAEERPLAPEWRKPRPLHTTDFGLFPALATNLLPGGTVEVLGTQEQLFEALRTSLENAARSEDPDDMTTVAQSWLREVVYGGVDGLAYMRSVAEFISPPLDMRSAPSGQNQCFNSALAEYVDSVLIDELTERRHREIEAAITQLEVPGKNILETIPVPKPPPVLPTPLDLGSLILTPNELFDAEKVWVGAGASEGPTVLSRALDHAAHLLDRLHAKRTEAKGTEMDVKSEESGEKEQDLEKELRMNLIALAKRAPLDQIAKIPPELVPSHLRHVVPIVGS